MPTPGFTVHVTATERQPSAERLLAALRAAGMSAVPARFSVATVRQEIPEAVLAEIEGFIRLFDQVTSRPAWREVATASAPEIARSPRSEVCFFSAWDFHLPPGPAGGLAAHRVQRQRLGPPVRGAHQPALLRALRTSADWPRRAAARVSGLRRARGRHGRAGGAGPSSGGCPMGSFSWSTMPSRSSGAASATSSSCCGSSCSPEGGMPRSPAPAELRWEGGAASRSTAARSSFVVNRSTDFFWEAEVLAALRAAYRAGHVYVAPNPFTYATRSDKALLELLSQRRRDDRLGIRPEERAVLTAHVPATRLLREDNVEGSPRGATSSSSSRPTASPGAGCSTARSVGRSRLRRLLRRAKATWRSSGCRRRSLVTEEGRAVDGPPRVGVSRPALPHVGPGLATPGPDRPRAARRVAADLHAPGRDTSNAPAVSAAASRDV